MEVNRSLDEITERWKKLSVEVMSVQTMLEEVVTYWRRYTACVDILTVWLADAEKMLDTPPQERGVSALTILPSLVDPLPQLVHFYPILFSPFFLPNPSCSPFTPSCSLIYPIHLVPHFTLSCSLFSPFCSPFTLSCFPVCLSQFDLHLSLCMWP